MDDNPGGGVGHVGELVFQADVAGGVNAAVGGLQPIIDHHPLPGIIPDAGRFQPQVLHVGGPAGPGQDLVHLDFARLPGAFVADQLAAVSLEDLNRFRRQDKVNTLPDKNLLHQLGGVGILPVHEAVVFVEQGHPAPQALQGLGELAAQGPASHDQETPGPFGQRKNRFVGEITGLGHPRDRRVHRPGARGDDRLAEVKRLAGRLDGSGAGKPRLAQEDVHPQVPEALGRIVAADGGPELPHALHDRSKVQLRSPAAP